MIVPKHSHIECYDQRGFTKNGCILLYSSRLLLRRVTVVVRRYAVSQISEKEVSSEKGRTVINVDGQVKETTSTTQSHFFVCGPIQRTGK
jgi:hypothetical protein